MSKCINQSRCERYAAWKPVKISRFWNVDNYSWCTISTVPSYNILCIIFQLEQVVLSVIQTEGIDCLLLLDKNEFFKKYGSKITMCKNYPEAVHRENSCDGRKDCVDRTDEENCTACK